MYLAGKLHHSELPTSTLDLIRLCQQGGVIHLTEQASHEMGHVHKVTKSHNVQVNNTCANHVIIQLML
jgi:hypothetical protein